MNIFVLDKNPILAAQYHCDKHVVKMILETAQILSTSIRLQGNTSDNVNLYRITHRGHPCVQWAGQSLANMTWLYRLGVALCEEYTYRWGKYHNSEPIIQLCNQLMVYGDYEFNHLTPFVQAMPDYCKDPDDVVDAYRTYYIMEKKHLLQYTKREKPSWIG